MLECNVGRYVPSHEHLQNDHADRVDVLLCVGELVAARHLSLDVKVGVAELVLPLADVA